MDEERDKQRWTYQLCRIGFALIAFALILASLLSILGLARIFINPAPFAIIVHSRLWRLMEPTIVWSSLLGSYLLWGRWSEPGWQRRAGLLLLMGTFDVVLWILEHGEELGLGLSEIGHPWLRHELGEALGWAEFALIASLACDLLSHLGVEQAPEAGKATRSLAATGAVVWFLFFCEQTIWRTWPLQKRGLDSLEALLLFLSTQMIWTVTLIQVTALTIATTRQTGRVLAELAREEQDHDLLKSPSDEDFGLLSTRFDPHGKGAEDQDRDENSW